MRLVCVYMLCSWSQINAATELMFAYVHELTSFAPRLYSPVFLYAVILHHAVR